MLCNFRFRHQNPDQVPSPISGEVGILPRNEGGNIVIPICSALSIDRAFGATATTLKLLLQKGYECCGPELEFFPAPWCKTRSIES